MANFTEPELNELSDNLIKLLSVMGESHYKDMYKWIAKWYGSRSQSN